MHEEKGLSLLSVLMAGFRFLFLFFTGKTNSNKTKRFPLKSLRTETLSLTQSLKDGGLRLCCVHSTRKSLEEAEVGLTSRISQAG